MGKTTQSKKSKPTTAGGEHFSTRNFRKGFRARLTALKGKDETLESVHNRTVEAGLKLFENAPAGTLEQVVRSEVEDNSHFVIPEIIEETLEQVESLGYEFLEEVRG